MKKLVTEGDHPNWLTQGRTVLVPKNSQQSQMSSNYQSITCLSTTCKFLSGILADKIGVHMEREKRSAQHRKCWAPQKVESKILCQQETRSDQLMDECKRLMTTWKIQIKLQPGIKSHLMVPGTKLYQNLLTFSTHINDSKKQRQIKHWGSDYCSWKAGPQHQDSRTRGLPHFVRSKKK